MNINAAIIDQRLSAVCNEIREAAKEELGITQEEKLKSLAFVYLTVKTVLDLPDEEAFDALTEGGEDFGTDAIHISKETDNEFAVTLFQGKYKKDLEAKSNFPETGIHALTNAIRHLFDPGSELEHINQRLRIKVEEVRSLIQDGYIPKVRAIACNNGIKWNDAAQEAIYLAAFGDQVSFEHINHDHLIGILQAPKSVNESLKFSGKAIVEDFNFSRVFIGRIAVTEIAALIQRHGERLLERNIRRYLGLHGNRVNLAIRDTLTGNDPANFYFYNNGITLICDKFTYNALQGGDFQVKTENLQIINGGQTCMTIYKTLQEGSSYSENAFVLVRLYQLPSDNEESVRQITYATNSQNPVDLRDLRSNDDIQRRLETDISQLGYTYRRKRTDFSKTTDITSSTAAEAILSVWRKKPHQARFFIREHFGKLYKEIFTNDLSGSQVIISVLIYRIAENKRKKSSQDTKPFIRYASCFIAMQMGKYLLRELGCSITELTHKNFSNAKTLIEQKGEEFFVKSAEDIENALQKLYREEEISLQQLAATFRRGDLIRILDKD